MSDEERPGTFVEVTKLPDDYLLVDAIVLMKCLTPDGTQVFREHYPPGLNIMERLGMCTSAADTCREFLRGTEAET